MRELEISVPLGTIRVVDAGRISVKRIQTRVRILLIRRGADFNAQGRIASLFLRGLCSNVSYFEHM